MSWLRKLLTYDYFYIKCLVINILINYKVSEAFFNDKENGSTEENNGEENVLSDKTEIIKPIAMRSSFAIGVCE